MQFQFENKSRLRKMKENEEKWRKMTRRRVTEYE